MPTGWQKWYPHQIDAWQSSATVQNFTDAAYRAFHNLLMEQYQQPDGMLPGDSALLAKMSRAGTKWSKEREPLSTIEEEVRSCFKVHKSGRIYNERQYTEWRWARAETKKRKKAGRLGGI